MASDLAQNGTRAVAVYACKPADLLEVVRITRPVESTVVLERSPYLEPLVAEAHEERWCVLLANRRNARFFVGDGGSLEETDRVEDDVHSQHDQGGWSQARYQRGVEKEKDDHLVHVADVAFGAYKERGFDRLLVGAPDELVGDLEQKLHPYLRERIVARLHLDVENSSVEDVRAAANAAIEDWRRHVEREALDRLAEGVGRGGRGAAGLAGVLQALNEQRVETLLVGETFHSAGGRDPETGMLYPGDHGPGDQELERCEDIVEPAIEKAIEQSARVIKVRYHDDLGPLGGIGAVLRY
jgi:peptide subunit release factor 1 (eRF1)